MFNTDRKAYLALRDAVPLKLCGQMVIYIPDYGGLPVVPARGRAEVALGLYYKTFLIHKTCMRRAPARPMRACFVRSCCAAVQEHDLSTTPAQCNAKQTLSSHFTLHSSHFTLALHTCTSHSLLASSQLFSSHRISSHMSSK